MFFTMGRPRKPTYSQSKNDVMRKTFFRVAFISNLLLIISFLGTAIFESSCTKAVQKESVSKNVSAKNWILDLTFLPNTDQELKDEAIRAIEKNLATSFSAEKYANNYPTFKVSKSVFGDGDRYRLSIGNTSTVCCIISPPPCGPPCPGACPACDSVNHKYGILTMKEGTK